MEQGSRDEPDQESTNKHKATGGMEVQCPGNQGHQQDAVVDRREGSNDRLVNDKEPLLRILPEELWLLVLEKLDSSDDLERVSNSSAYFRQLLLSERVKFLFKNVWQIIGWKYEHCFTPTDDSDDNHDGNEDNSNDSMPLPPMPRPSMFRRELIFSEPKEATKETLILRLVCRSWSKDIDKLYEKPNLELNRMADVTSLLSHFEATHGSITNTRIPFLGTKVTITVARRNNDIGMEFVHGIHAVLDKYGQHFLECCFKVFPTSRRLVTSYCSRIGTMMQRMPKLRKLEIIRGFCPRPFTSADLGEVEAENNANPFLLLEELQELTVDHVPLPFFRQLIRSNGHVSTSTTALAHVVGDHAVFDGPFVSNLKSLSIIACPPNVFQVIIDTQFDWRLTKLDLDLTRFCDFTVWQRIFNNAFENKFGNTLTELRLQLPLMTSKEEWDRVYEMSKNYKLHLSQLTKLELRLFEGSFPCLDFLLSMKDILRSFILIIECPYSWNPWMKRIEDYDDAAGVLKIWSCLQCPLESNVWTLFPKLEVFEITDNALVYGGRRRVSVSFSCTRHRWRMQMQNRKESRLVN